MPKAQAITLLTLSISIGLTSQFFAFDSSPEESSVSDMMGSIDNFIDDVVDKDYEPRGSQWSNMSVGGPGHRGRSSVVEIRNGMMIEKIFKNGKLEKVKKRKMNTNGNSVNIVNGGSSRNVSICSHHNGGGTRQGGHVDFDVQGFGEGFFPGEWFPEVFGRRRRRHKRGRSGYRDKRVKYDKKHRNWVRRKANHKKRKCTCEKKHKNKHKLHVFKKHREKKSKHKHLLGLTKSDPKKRKIKRHTQKHNKRWKLQSFKSKKAKHDKLLNKVMEAKELKTHKLSKLVKKKLDKLTIKLNKIDPKKQAHTPKKKQSKKPKTSKKTINKVAVKAETSSTTKKEDKKKRKIKKSTNKKSQKRSSNKKSEEKHLGDSKHPSKKKTGNTKTPDQKASTIS